MSINNVILTGRHVREPELKYSQSGMAFCRFNLAVNRMKKDDPADFISCIAFGKTAELIGEYMHKGDPMGVVGRIQTGSYEKDGNKIYTTDVMVNSIEFIGSSNKNAKTENSKPKPKTGSKQENNLEEEDEFPF
jgi:single-strand DNA-binding protein